jgi:hypothetical protein
MMAGMKVTLSAAMRARDVSRPRADDEEAARGADGAGASGPGASGPGANGPGAVGNAAGNARGRAGRTDSADRPGRPESRGEGRTESSDRSATPKNSAGRRRKRR